MWLDADAPDPVFTDTLSLDMVDGRAVARRAQAPAGQGAAVRARRRIRRRARQGIWRQGRHRRARRGRRRRSRPRRMATSSSPRSPAAPTPRTRRCWSPPAWSPARRARSGSIPSPGSRPRSRRASRSSPTISTSAGLSADLDAIGFDLVGYGCTTCIGNSGPLPEPISKAINEQRHRRRLGAVGQPQLRRPRLARRARQLSRLAAAGRRLCAQGHGDRGHDHHARSARAATARTSISRTSGRPTTRSARLIDDARQFATCSASRYADVYKGDEHWRAIEVTRRRHLCAGAAGSTYIANPPYFEGMSMTPVADRRHHRRAAAGDLRRQHHHRPHQPRRRDQGRQPGRQIPDRASGRARRLQQLRRPPRQSRSDDARHLRQHPHQEPDGRRHRRRHDPLHPDRRGDADLRRRDEATRPTARRWSSSPARNMAPARRATGRPRAPICSACAR